MVRWQRDRLAAGVWLIAGALVLIASPAAAAASIESDAKPCVEVQIGNDNSSHLNCVNDILQRQVSQERQAQQPAAPIDARSASNKVGTFNEAGTREMMGNAYGVSAQPQRPKTSFSNPLLSTAQH